MLAQRFKIGTHGVLDALADFVASVGAGFGHREASLRSSSFTGDAQAYSRAANLKNVVWALPTIDNLFRPYPHFFRSKMRLRIEESFAW